MDAVRIHGLRDIRFEQGIPKPSPGKDEVLIAIRRCGICGSDVHLWLQDYGATAQSYPFICCHEASGVVEELGEGVTNVKVGDRVCIEPIPPQATNMLAQYYVHPAYKVHKLADHLSFDQGAMVEPFAVGVHAVKRAGVKKGDNVLVLGAGPIGQFSLIASRAYGAARIVVTDIKAGRLSTVELFGADATFNVQGLAPDEAGAKVKELFPDGKIDVVLDGVGNEASLGTACAAVKFGGTVLVVGVATLRPKIPYYHVVARELSVIGSIYYGDDYKEALELITSGKVDIKAMGSHHVSFDWLKMKATVADTYRTKNAGCHVSSQGCLRMVLERGRRCREGRLQMPLRRFQRVGVCKKDQVYRHKTDCFLKKNSCTTY